MKSIKNILSDLGLPFCGSASEFVEVAIKPVVNLLVNNMIVVADFLRSLFFFKSLHLSGCSVLIGTANVQCVVAHKAAVASEDVCTQHTSNDVAKMRNIIHIGQGTRDQNVSLIGLGKDKTSALNTVDLGVRL